MKHARSDYDRIQDPQGKIPEDEPVFLIRGQDAVGAVTVHQWAANAEKAGASPEIVEAAREQARRMASWPKKKLPNMPKGASTYKVGDK